MKLRMTTPGWSGKVRLHMAGIEDLLILGIPWLNQVQATLDFSQQSEGEIFFVQEGFDPYSNKHHQAWFNLISKRQLWWIQQQGCDTFVVFVREAHAETPKPLPPDMQALLNKFYNIFPNELPAGLPPK